MIPISGLLVSDIRYTRCRVLSDIGVYSDIRVYPILVILRYRVLSKTYPLSGTISGYTDVGYFDSDIGVCQESNCSCQIHCWVCYGHSEGRAREPDLDSRSVSRLSHRRRRLLSPSRLGLGVQVHGSRGRRRVTVASGPGRAGCRCCFHPEPEARPRRLRLGSSGLGPGSARG
jgi:hypothetical protein